MKSLHHLFKSVIVINYSTNPDGYTYDSVKEIAVESKFKFADYDIGDLFGIAESIIKTLVQKDPSDEDIEEFLRSELPEVSDQNVRDILKLWNNEKTNIFGFLQKKYTQSYILNDTKWSVNQKTFGKNANSVKEITTVFALDLMNIENPKEQKSCVFEMNPAELNNFCDELEGIEAQIEKLLQTK